MPAENIFAAYTQPVRSVMDYQNDMDRRDLLQTQLQGAKRQNAIADLTAVQTQDTMRQGALARQAARQASDQAKGDPVEYARLLQISGFPENIPLADQVLKAHTERIKGEAAAGKDRSEAGAKDVETENKVIATYRDLVGNATNPEQAAQYVQIMHSDPRLKNTGLARVPIEQALSQIGTDPQSFEQWKQKFALGATKFVEQNKPQYITQNLGGTSRITAVPGLGVGPSVTASEAAITQSADNAANQATALAGQRRMAADAAAGRAQAAQLAAGAVTYQQDADGNLVALPARAVPGTVIKAQPVVAPGAGMVPLPGKDANLTEGQEKSLMFGTKMAQSAKVLEEVGKKADMRGAIKGTAMAAGGMVPFIGDKVSDIAGTLTNFTQSEAQQRYEAAKYQWIAGLLRKESGAVISPSEYAAADVQYFPQPADDEQTKADKAQQRLLQQKTMLEGVPRNKRPKDGASPTDAGATANKALEDALNKYSKPGVK